MTSDEKAEAVVFALAPMCPQCGSEVTEWRLDKAPERESPYFCDTCSAFIYRTRAQRYNLYPHTKGHPENLAGYIYIEELTDAY